MRVGFLPQVGGKKPLVLNLQTKRGDCIKNTIVMQVLSQGETAFNKHATMNGCWLWESTAPIFVIRFTIFLYIADRHRCFLTRPQAHTMHRTDFSTDLGYCSKKLGTNQTRPVSSLELLSWQGAFYPTHRWAPWTPFFFVFGEIVIGNLSIGLSLFILIGRPTWGN